MLLLHNNTLNITMFYRKYLKDLELWSDKEGRKPLILRGARQTGKTTLVKMFAKQFDQFINLNLEKKEDNNLFDDSNNIHKLIDAIFFIKNASKQRKRTLLFIDEIQNNVNAVNSLRYFYEEIIDIWVIAAGSLLESLIDRNFTFPVGRVEYLAIRPFTFEEFLIAKNENNAIEIIKSNDIPDYAHSKLNDLFKTYTIIGGLPEIISNYIKYNDFNQLKKVFENMLISYFDDIEKYAKNNKQALIIKSVLQLSFKHASKRITFEKFGHTNYGSREISEALRLLEKTLLLSLVNPCTKTRLPIEEKLRMSPKLFLFDTGLVNHVSSLQKQLFLSDNIDDNQTGLIAEQITAQQLLALNDSPIAKLNFWVPKTKTSQAEVDFVHIYEDLLLPIEVKAGATGRLRSLFRFVDESPHNFAIRIYSGKFSVEDANTIKGKQFKLINLPFYLTSQLNKVISKNI